MFIEELADLEQDTERKAICANCKRVKPLYMYPRDSYEICMPCRAKAIENNHAYTCTTERINA